MKVIDIPLSAIDVGVRRRIEFGDIDALAKGMKRVGQLAPIIVDRDDGRFRLVAGERRLRAAHLLKWETIAAHLKGDLSSEELRDIELEENENRKSLTARERQRTFTAAKKLVEQVDTARKQLVQSGPVAKSPKGGNPKKPDSTRAVAEAVAESRQSINRAQQHVALAERLPFMQGNGWRESHVLQVRELLTDFPKEEQPEAEHVIGRLQVAPPSTTTNLLKKLRDKPPSERKDIYRLSHSADPREVSLAITRAVELPPTPDQRIELMHEAITAVTKARNLYPGDPLQERLAGALSILKELQSAIREQWRENSRKGAA